MNENIEQEVTRGLVSNSNYGQTKSYPFATEEISLPSKGLVYPESSPLSKGYVTVKLLTAKEEDILTSAALIRKGVQIDRLLESIVVDSSVNVSDLLIGDKNAILVASRVLAYGPVYNVSVTDPKENELVDVEVDMAKLSTKEIDESLLNRENEYPFVLPKSKTPIKFKLLTHGDEILIQKDIDASEKTLKQSNEITTRWRRIIVEVNGNRDLGYISNFVINQFQIQDSKALRNHIKDMTPDVDFTFEYTSPFTGEKEALRVPIGVDFFYPSE
jgi:hypothetical protein